MTAIVSEANAYIRVMNDVKRRVEVAQAFIDLRANAIYKPTQIESAVLQVRMIAELIALASIAAHTEVFKQHQMRFKDHWKPVDTFKDIERINPGYFPRPFKPVENASGIIDHKNLDDGEYLTKLQLIEMHGRCSDLLHAKNPFGKQANYNWYWEQVPVWLEKIVKLLNFHEIYLLGIERMWVVQMEVDGRVAMTPFEMVDQK